MSGSATPLDSERLDAIVQKVLPFASAADAFARRSLGKVRTLAMLGLLAGAWISYACADTFDWRLPTFLIMLPIFALPPALLWKIPRTLHATIGLPQRIHETATRFAGKAAEYRQRYANRHPLDPTAQKPRLKQLWQAGQVMLEVRSMGGEAQEIVSASAGALVLANPLFLVVLGCATATAMVLIGVAAIVAVAYIV